MSKQDIPETVPASDGEEVNRGKGGFPPPLIVRPGERSPAPDPFDPANFVLDQSYLHDSVSQKVLLEVNMRKPARDEFFRVHSDPSYRVGPVATIKDDRTDYIIDPALAKRAKIQHTVSTLYTCINIDHELFLWPATVPGSGGGSILAWHTSAITAATTAMTQWIKLVSDNNAKRYDGFVAQGELDEPEWPALTMAEILKLAFRDRHITDYDHPVLRKKRGIR
jgi:hypothetical protein